MSGVPDAQEKLLLSLSALSLTAPPPDPAPRPPLSTSARSERRRRCRQHKAAHKAEDSTRLVPALCWRGQPSLSPPLPRTGARCDALMRLAGVCLQLGMDVAGGLVRDSLAGLEPNDLDVDLHVPYDFGKEAAAKAMELALQVRPGGINVTTIRVSTNVCTLEARFNHHTVVVQIANAVAFRQMNGGRPRFDVDNLVIRSHSSACDQTVECRYEVEGLERDDAVSNCQNRLFKCVQDAREHQGRIAHMVARGWKLIL